MEYDYSGIGHFSGGVPSDGPGTGLNWNYATVKFIVRTRAKATGVTDGVVIVFSWADNKVAIRSVANNQFSGNWTMIG